MKVVNDPIGMAGAVPAPAEPRAGQIIGDRYRLEELLERGAMGSVWRAEQITLRAPVAIKFLDPALMALPEMSHRFLQEARSAAAIRSVHVVQIFDYGSDDDVPFIAMEYLEGEDLDARLTRKGTLTPAELEKIFSEVARGIGQGHALGVIHRDLKPSNIFLAREGEHEVTKVIDFGIAKVTLSALELGKSRSIRNVGTGLGTLLGTPQYMSPEQVRGSGLLDHRTDLWALAIIACECLTGRYPFSGKSLGDLTVQICTERPRAPSSLGPVPTGFDRWFFKATSKKAAQRFDSAEEMAAALGALLLSTRERPKPERSERLQVASHGISGTMAHISTLAAVFHGRTVAWVSEPLSRARPLVSRKRWLALALVMLGFGPLVLLRPGIARVDRAEESAPLVAAAPTPLTTAAPRTPDTQPVPTPAEAPSIGSSVLPAARDREGRAASAKAAGSVPARQRRPRWGR
jgi:eukaryotic-like serine/threonine-protein kinase